MIDKNLGRVVPFALSPGQMRRGAEEHRRRGQHTEAVELLHRAAEQDDSILGWLHLAEQWRRIGCWEQAENLLRRLLAREDALPDIWLELARCQQALGQQDAAADSLYHYLDEEPYSEAADAARGMLAAMEQPDEERDAFRLPLLIRRGLEAWRAGRHEVGLARLDRAAFMACHPARLYVTMALLLMAQARYQDAVTVLASALRAEPGHPRASCMLCVALSAAGKKRAARGFLRQCMPLCTAPEGEEAFLTAAWAVSANAEAEEYLALRLKKHPLRIALMRPMAELMWATGRREEALRWWRRILRVDSGDVQARALLARAQRDPDAPALPAGALPPECVQAMLESLVRAAREKLPAREMLAPGSETCAALRWCLAAPKPELQQMAAALLIREDAPRSRLLAREALLHPILTQDTRQTLLLWLARLGETGPALVAVGHRVATASCTPMENRPAPWMLFLPQLMQDAPHACPKAGLLAYAAALWRCLTPAQREAAATRDAYAWTRAIEMIYLRRMGREKEAAALAADTMISVRKICRILRAIVRRTGAYT